MNSSTHRYLYRTVKRANARTHTSEDQSLIYVENENGKESKIIERISFALRLPCYLCTVYILDSGLSWKCWEGATFANENSMPWASVPCLCSFFSFTRASNSLFTKSMHGYAHSALIISFGCGSQSMNPHFRMWTVVYEPALTPAC